MYFVDNGSAVPVMPQVKPVSSATPQFFTEGGNGTPPTYPGPDWFNIFQLELLNVLKEAQINPDKANHTQLVTAMKKLFLDASSNGSDIPDKATFLSNLGLEDLPATFGDAASKNVGTTAGTVAAGDDSRFDMMLGVGQTPQDVTASRSLGVTYTNSTGKPIAVGVGATGGPALTLTATVSGVRFAYDSSTAERIAGNGVFFIVPAGATYSVAASQSSGVLLFWTELR
ncbi:hypothetical protein ACMVR4_002620 [Yersinia enterocolitica]